MGIKEKLIMLFTKKDYHGYIEEFNNYLKEELAVDLEMIFNYVNVLTKLKQFDEAKSILYHFYDDAIKSGNKFWLAKLFFFSYDLDKAREIFLSIEELPTLGIFYLARISLLEGKYDEATRLFEEYIEACTKKGLKIHYRTKDYLKEIDNHKKYGAFVEMDYASFLKNGNALTPGYIVFLKGSPESINGSDDFEDEKVDSRPYLIWKIEGDRLLLFPVTEVVYFYSYVLYQQYYPNAPFDRCIKDSIAISTVDNILTIKDRLSDSDFERIIRKNFQLTYAIDDEQRSQRDEFLRNYIGDVSPYQIISYFDREKRYLCFYFVADITDTEYIGHQISRDFSTIIGPEISIPKEMYIYQKIDTNLDEVKSLLAQIDRSRT